MSAAAPDRAAERVITVGLCTFRRPGVVATLESLAAQALPAGTAVVVAVADNDDTPSSEPLVRETAARLGLALRYAHAPARNISVARNAVLDAADTRWLAFLDDDELAAPDWVARLLAAAADDGAAAAVFGPAVARYAPGSPDWAAACDFHSNRIPETEDAILSGYTSNVLIDMDFVRRHGLRFRTELGRTGGEDTVFFHEMHRLGGALRYAPDAAVFEDVQPGRVNLDWVWRRKYRSGQTHALLLEMRGQTGARQKAIVAAKAAACFAMAAASALNRNRRLGWTARGLLHVGVLSRLSNRRLTVEYGEN